MSAPIRALVVDDSAVVRRLVSDALAADDGIEVVGVAANGRIALAKTDQLRPDVVILDVEMPEMDGLTALAEMRRRHPLVAVIMFSTLTERGAAATLDALALGARDYVTKPTGNGSIAAAVAAVRAELAPRIRAACGRHRPASAAAPAAPVVRPPARGVPGRVDVVVVGVSTGGPNALGALVPALPADLAVPVVVVQHMPPTFTRLLAERLDVAGRVSVSEGVEGVVPGRGTVVIAPGGRHLVLRRRRLLGPTTAPGAVARASAGAHPAGPLGPVEVHLTDDPPESSCRPAVDPLLRSAVEVHGARVLAVVLTGMGSDGLRGCEAVVRAGGQVIAQDAATSVVWGMPGEVARAGLADAVLPLERVAAEITRRVAVGRPPTTAPSASTGAARVPASHGGPPATLSGWARPRGAA